MSDKILIVDDEPFNMNILGQELTDRGFAIETASNGRGGLKKVETSRPDLILLDYMMPDLSGLDVLKELRKGGIDTPVIMITAHGTIDRAVEAMREGAYDFITRPFEPDHIALLVQKALERERLKRGVEILSEEVGQRYRLIVGESSNMKHAVELARKAASASATVLLLGESGTGKEIFARAIHNWSERKDKPFVTINCVGLSKELLESELFGHEQGAFTGAHQLKRGKMELAHGGTVFLDEVGDISTELQTKLLRFLQEREFERVGGTKPISVDIRIIAATNRDLEVAIKEGLFREDLYHRLNVVPITLPPLRDRKEDIPILSRYFLRKYSMETRKNFSEITSVAQEKLLSYDWPGNVRELANVIERAIVLSSGPNIALEDLPGIFAIFKTETALDNVSYHGAVNAARRDVVLKALTRTQGNRAAAAKTLGLNPKYFFKLLKSLRIE
ncbi:MAG: sigma-54-dependent transcriptional regulator [Candidatus Bipolaricaulia bacterium]